MAKKKSAAKPVKKKPAPKSAKQSLPFPPGADDKIAAAEALAAIDGEVAELDSDIERSQERTAELKAKRKQLLKDRERASLDLRLIASGRRPVFPTEDRRPDDAKPAAEKPAESEGESGVVHGTAPETFTDGGLTTLVSRQPRGSFVVDAWSIEFSEGDGPPEFKGKIAKHYTTQDAARIAALEAAIVRMLPYSDKEPYTTATRDLQDARRKFPGYENASDYSKK